jgi:hypothetical protein
MQGPGMFDVRMPAAVVYRIMGHRMLGFDWQDDHREGK